MLVVKQKVFVNQTQSAVNDFLLNIPAENVLSTHFFVHGFESQSDEWTTIFYKEETA